MSAGANGPRRIGLVGLGEVGRVVVAELAAKGSAPLCLDARGRSGAVAAELDLRLTTNEADFGTAVDLVIVTVVGQESLALAQAVVPWLAPGTVYADWTTTSPHTRDEVGSICRDHGVDFADVVILDTVSWGDRTIELLVSGPGSAPLGDLFAGTRFFVNVIDEARAVSTEIKLLRSVFTKGLEALLIETLGAAEALGLREEVERSVLRFTEVDFSRIISLLVGSSLRHARRRAKEVADVLELLEDRLGAAPMTASAVEILNELAAITERASAPPAEPAAVLDRVLQEELFVRLKSPSRAVSAPRD